MKTTQFTSSSLFLLTVAALFALASCSGGRQSAGEGADSTACIDSLAVQTDDAQPNTPLVADAELNQAARLYAGVSSEGIEMSQADAQAWQKYSKQMASVLTEARKVHLDPVDSLMRTDADDARKVIDYVFYPCAGADFVYPFVLFPDADTYFLIGLEPAGKPIRQFTTHFKRYEAYRNALRTYFHSSYFITKDMKEDLQSDELHGTVPVIIMLMALSDCEIVSARNCSFTEDGAISDAVENPNLVELQFFRKGSNHLQRLYYLSTNLCTSALDPLLQKYITTTLPRHRVATFLKAASYILRHDDTFGAIRQLILDHSIAVLQDDSGIPYRCFDHRQWALTLYGQYVKPRPCFDADTYQPDLEQVFKVEPTVHPLSFHIGYARPSNWMIARKKKNPESSPLVE